MFTPKERSPPQLEKTPKGTIDVDAETIPSDTEAMAAAIGIDELDRLSHALFTTLADPIPNAQLRVDEDEMKKLGMGSLLGVSQGSAEPAQLIVLTYEPKETTSTETIPPFTQSASAALPKHPAKLAFDNITNFSSGTLVK